jgi:hypothetical protein
MIVGRAARIWHTILGMKKILFALLLVTLTFWISTIVSPVQAVEVAPAAVVYLSSDDTVAEGREFREGETISTQNGLMVKLPDGSDLEIDAGTTVRITQLPRTNQRVTKLTLSRGAVRSRVAATGSNGSYSVTTPVAVAGVRGTDFSVSYDPGPANATVANDDGMELDVFEGTVAVEQEGEEEQRVEAGNGASVNRRQVRRRAIAEKVRERWQNRRESMMNHLRQRLNLGPDDDLGEKLRERLRDMPPERREEIKQRLQQMQREMRERATARATTQARERRVERRVERRTNHPATRR